MSDEPMKLNIVTTGQLVREANAGRREIARLTAALESAERTLSERTRERDEALAEVVRVKCAHSDLATMLIEARRLVEELAGTIREERLRPGLDGIGTIPCNLSNLCTLGLGHDGSCSPSWPTPSPASPAAVEDGPASGSGEAS